MVLYMLTEPVDVSTNRFLKAVAFFIIPYILICFMMTHTLPAILVRLLKYPTTTSDATDSDKK